jgi:hypothetical protein
VRVKQFAQEPIKTNRPHFSTKTRLPQVFLCGSSFLPQATNPSRATLAEARHDSSSMRTRSRRNTIGPTSIELGSRSSLPTSFQVLLHSAILAESVCLRAAYEVRVHPVLSDSAPCASPGCPTPLRAPRQVVRLLRAPRQAVRAVRCLWPSVACAFRCLWPSVACGRPSPVQSVACAIRRPSSFLARPVRFLLRFFRGPLRLSLCVLRCGLSRLSSHWPLEFLARRVPSPTSP